MQPRQPLAEVYHPPQQPQIPLQAINALIPRITTTINDIDAFKNILAAGNADGSMPTWDALLQRYSLLLGRITALSEYISRPTPSNLSSTSTNPEPALSKYIIHPLNSLPIDSNPLAGDTFFQALNTLPLPEVDPAEHVTRMKGMSEEDVGRLLNGLRGRLKRESEMSRSILEEVERVGGEMDWELRIGDEGEGEGEGAEGSSEAKLEKTVKEENFGEEDEDLFGDDAEDEVVLIDPPPSTETGNQAEKRLENDVDKGKSPNPKEGWTVVDHVRFMETGKQPAYTVL